MSAALRSPGRRGVADLVDHDRSKHILALMDASRAALIGLYLMEPKTEWTLYPFAIGGFLGAYPGGLALAYTGSYTWMWYADMVLAAAAALVNLPIREARVGPAVQPASA